MIRKKNRQHEETVQKNGAEAIDNKENTDMNNDDNQVVHDDVADSSNEPENIKTETEQANDIDKADRELQETVAKLAEMQDKYIRLSAEFDNYRKRTLKEKMDISKYAGEDILRKIIPFMDDFDRALKHLNESADYEGMKNGIELIYNKFDDFLKHNGVKEIEAMNADFDVDIHEAVAKTPAADEKMKGKIVDVALKGYYLNDKVLRFSKVIIGE
ncbi:MAG: nucleotide exchange factor GrpE [Bacteroidales bacterium]|jgi:molecular chaperone GrpE|nr:nucleotide exchange factor GrpE [Bacteroidales bacterium]